ncbi:segregation/condensation protein A [Myxococcota bacterium]|nr:segregation/condensation protein A [Myxococcota bacterium]
MEAIAPPPRPADLPRVHIQVFEGPLDLLLHLCRKSEVDVTSISIVAITEQYLEYLDLMKRLDLEIAGEFLAMAATLCYLKSRELLPRAPEPDEEEEGGDPRQDLILRLLEYRKYKDAADALARARVLDRDAFVRPDTAAARDSAGPAPVDASLFDLLSALRELLAERARGPAEHHVLLDPVSIRECMRFLYRGLRHAGGSATFRGLFDGCESRRQVLVTFLALLELTRLKVLRVRQDEPHGEILLDLRWEGPEESLPFGEAEIDAGGEA